MAIKRWTGGARGVRQVSTIKFSGVPSLGDKYVVSVGYAAVTYTIEKAVTNSDVVAELVRLMNAATSPLEFTDAFWTADTDHIVATGTISGVPFAVEVSCSNQQISIFVETQVRATGPNHFDNPDNWLDGSLPELDDSVFVSGGNSIYYGMDSPRAFTELHVPSDFAGQIGLEEKNARGYREYRPTYCAWSAKYMTVGPGGSLNSPMLKLELNDSETKLRIHSTGIAQKSTEPPVQIRGAFGELEVESGSVAIATRAYDLASFNNLHIHPNAFVKIGADVVADKITSRGTSDIDCDCNVLAVAGGKSHFRGKANEIDIVGGELIYQSSKDIHQLKVGPGVFYYAGLTNCVCETLRLRTGGQLADPTKAIQAETIVLEGSISLSSNS